MLGDMVTLGSPEVLPFFKGPSLQVRIGFLLLNVQQPEKIGKGLDPLYCLVKNGIPMDSQSMDYDDTMIAIAIIPNILKGR